MVGIALERFCAVWLPHSSKMIFTHRRTFLLVLFIGIFSAISSTWFIFVLNVVHFEFPSSTSNDSFVFTKCAVNNDGLYDMLGMFSVTVNYILPFVFVLSLNSTVIYRLCQRGMVEIMSSITVMLTLVCLVHLFCTLPFQCWWIYYEIPDQSGDCIWLERKLRWRTITFTIRNFNYMANFFLYSCSSKLFRDELKGLILLSLLPHPKYQNYHYRRRSLYENTQRVSLTRLIMRRLSRTNDVTHIGLTHLATSAGPVTDV